MGNKEGEMMKILACMLLAALLSGCMSPKNFFHPESAVVVGEKGAFSIKEPEKSVVILFTPGSPRTDFPVPCDKNPVPQVLRDLSGTLMDGKHVLVHGYCPTGVGNFQGAMSQSESWVPEIEAVVRLYQNQGVSPEHIFLSGQSMGGWASVLVAAKKNVEIAGIIAFAPANGIGFKRGRNGNGWAAYARQKEAMQGISRLNGLLYVFHNDPFNTPEDLAFMNGIPGLQYVALDGATLGDGSCAKRSPHGLGYSSCFASTEMMRIVEFMYSRMKK